MRILGIDALSAGSLRDVPRGNNSSPRRRTRGSTTRNCCGVSVRHGPCVAKAGERPETSHHECDTKLRQDDPRVPRRSILGAAGGLALADLLVCCNEALARDASNSGAALSRPTSTTLEDGVQLITFQEGTGPYPESGNTVVIHYTGRLGAKQGWRFDSTFDHKDEYGGPEPYSFVLGSPAVIKGLSLAVQSMRVGGIARAVIPPAVAYQSTSDEPLPPNFFDRQRLFTTVFNPTRIQNGEQETLGTVIFDIRLLGIRPKP